MPGTRFYVQRPVDKYWNTGCSDFVIEASEIDPNDATLHSYQKKDEFVREYLKVVNPADFKWKTVRKAAWIECNGPAMPLDHDEYMLFYHKLDPSRPFPEGFGTGRLPWLEQTGKADEIRKKFNL